MNRSIVVSAASAVAIVFLVQPAADAQPIPAGTAIYTFDNSFFTRLFPGSPFNPGTEAIDVPVQVSGMFTQTWQDQVGDEILDELTGVRSVGALPGPIPFEILAGSDLTPELGPFLGSLSDITQDPGDGTLTSASRRVGGAFAQVLADGTFLYTVDPYTFEANVTGLPFPVGTEFIGTDDSSPFVRIRLGATIDPANDPIIGQTLPGGSLTITGIIPEPGTGVLALAALALGWRPRRG